MLEKGTLRYDIERIRVYIADLLLKKVRKREIKREEIKGISQAVLDKTEKVVSQEELDLILNQLVEKYPILERAKIKNMLYEETELHQKAAAEVTRLLREGKFEEAGELAAQYNKPKQND